MICKIRDLPQYLQVVVAAIICIVGMIGFSILSGIFVPLQSSELVGLGICSQNKTYQPQPQISGNTEVLYICGIIEGTTKRSISFSLFHNAQVVFNRSGNWDPGEFFILMDASQLHYISSSIFPPGKYRLEAAYGREPFMIFEFTIEPFD